MIRLHNRRFFWGSLALLGLLSFTDLGPKTDVAPVLTPAQEQATFRLEPGLKIELVAAEPLVQDPVVITFDEKGRLWVVEMRGFMPDVTGKGEDKPVGRVSVLEDRNGDGRMDVGTVYMDSLVLPRAVAIVRDGVLIAENSVLWLTKDTNGDGKADTKILIDKDYAGSTQPEHAGNGLWRGMDNWYYNAKSKRRYRLQGDTWERDSTEFRGQWGISHDNDGHLFYNYNWSQLHADLVPPNYLNRNRHHSPTTGIDYGLTVDRRVYPIRATPVNRGYIPGTLDTAGRLQEFTAACSPLVYRGNALPEAYAGNAFVCEPAGNLIKRNLVAHDGLLLTAKDPNPGTEFLASTDQRFRPVHLATGPDGALYVADMYRGIIQDKAYMTPYLRDQTLLHGLETPINRGRIWRIMPATGKRSKPRKLAGLASAKLVNYLSHTDGWYRDMAQRLLVERNDVAVVPALTELTSPKNRTLGRFHALWTLDGLHRNDPDNLLRLVADADPLVQTTALRLLEPIARANPAVRTQLETLLVNTGIKGDVTVVLQEALTAQALSPKPQYALLARIVEQYGSLPLMRDAVMSSLQDREFDFLQTLLAGTPGQNAPTEQGIFLEILTNAIVKKRDPTQLTALLNRLEHPSQLADWQEKALLTGLTIGGKPGKPVPLSAAPTTLLASNRLNDTQRRVLTTLFDWPGKVTEVKGTTAKIVLSADDMQVFAKGRQLYLNTCAGCHGNDGAGMNRFAPTLIGSDWVLGNEKRLALIVLHGMEGAIEVAGKVYNSPDILPVMPAHSTMDDAGLTAILTYIRNEWGNNAGPMAKHTVGMTRVLSQGRVTPWTAKELNLYIEKNKTTPSPQGK